MKGLKQTNDLISLRDWVPTQWHDPMDKNQRGSTGMPCISMLLCWLVSSYYGLIRGMTPAPNQFV